MEYGLHFFHDFVSAYLSYTYPYSLLGRIKDIKKEIQTRKLVGLIHYVQSFCHRQMESIIMKKEIDIPILFLEGESPENTNAQQLMRIEAFVSIINDQS